VSIDGIKYIGKESNSLKVVESGLVHDHQNVSTEYPDERRDEWATEILLVLKKLPSQFLADQTGLSLTAIKDTLAVRSRPYPENRKRLTAIVQKLGLH